jgi:hypothetical protein
VFSQNTRLKLYLVLIIVRHIDIDPVLGFVHHVEVGGVVNVSVVHSGASIFRVKVSRIHEHSSHILLTSMYHQNTRNTAHFHTVQRPKSKININDEPP